MFEVSSWSGWYEPVKYVENMKCEIFFSFFWTNDCAVDFITIPLAYLVVEFSDVSHIPLSLDS